MENLTLNQLRLLRLCYSNPGPFLSEMDEYAEYYGIIRENIRSDYIELLSQHLVRPLGSIDMTIYLPSHCIVTELGEQALIKAEREVPNLIPPERFVCHGDTRTKQEIFEALTTSWPKFDSIGSDQIAELAEIYLYWAESTDQAKELSIPTNELFNAAARGFGKIGDLRRYIKGLRGIFTSLAEKGRYLDLAITGADMLKELPRFGQATVDCLSSALREPYHDLTGEEMTLLSETNYFEFLKGFVKKSIDSGKKYRWGVPHKNHLIGIANRIEDILGEAFKTSNKSLFLQTVNLQYIYVNLLESMVEIPRSLASFEDRCGYARCAERARRICCALEGFAALVHLPEPQRKDAFQAVLEIIRNISRLTAVPIWDASERYSSEDNRASQWIFNLIGVPDRRVMARLLPQFEKLENFVSQLDKEDAKRMKAIQHVVDTSSIQTDLYQLKMTLEKIHENTSYTYYEKISRAC